MLGFSRQGLLKALCVVLGILGICWLALEYFIPSPPSRITLATGAQGTSLRYFGQRYRDRLARVGIDVDLRETAGTTENCKLLRDRNSGVDVSIVTPGFCDNGQGSELLSLGDVYVVPIWIFYSSPEPLVGLSQLKGKRIAIGSEGSGARDIAERILGKANVDSNAATLLPLGGTAAVNALNDGAVDAVFIVSVPDAPAIKALLSNPRFRLMDVSTAETFTRIFPAFTKLAWPKGMVEIDPPNPQNDVTLLGVTSTVVVRGNVHPAIIQILARTFKEEHGGPGLFQRAGEFPKSVDSEFPMSQIAVDYYKNGPSFLQEYLPFWIAIYARRTIAVLVATLAIVFPVFGFAPKLYGWVVQEHLRRLYRRLRSVENALQAGPNPSRVETLQKELADIDLEASAVPLRSSDLYFTLKYHLDRMHSRLLEASRAAHAGESRT
jgi:TRAP-type uncharacterized transport system substrate-binding protein